MNYFKEYAPKATNIGYFVHPIKVASKVPAINEWPEKRLTIDEINSMAANSYSNCGVGVNTATTPALDVDIYDDDVASQMIDYIKNALGDAAFTRVGMAPKSLFPCRGYFPDKQKSKLFISPDGKVNAIELLADGQQFIAFGIHEDTKKPYTWPDGKDVSNTKCEDLPPLDQEAVNAIFSKFEEMAVKAGWQEQQTKKDQKYSGPMRDPLPIDRSKPWDDFNYQHSVPEMLLHNGWKKAGGSGSEQHFTRPGKESGTSACYNHDKYQLCVYSTGAYPLEEKKQYTAFGIYAEYEHGGNIDSAVRAIRDKGFGYQVDVSTGNIDGFLDSLNKDDDESCVLAEDQQGVFTANKKTDLSKVENIPGVLGLVADYFNDSSVEYQPSFAVHVAVAVGSIVLSRNYCTDYGNYTSLYQFFIAESGTGKDTVKSVIKKILKESGLSSLLGPSWFTADSSLINSLKKNPRQIMLSDEMGRRLQNASVGKVSEIELLTKLMEVFSSAHDSVDGKQYVDGSHASCERPAVTICGITTQSTFMGAVTTQMVEDGFLNRWLYCVSDVKKSAKLRKKKGAVDPELIKWCKEYGFCPDPKNNLSSMEEAETHPPTEIPFGPGCVELLEQFEERNIVLSEKLQKLSLHPMTQRLREIAMRISLIVAISCRYDTVSADNVAWSIKYVENLAVASIDMIKRNLAGTPFERYKLAFLEKIRQAGRKGIKLSQIGRTKPFSELTKRERVEALEDLMEGEKPLIEIRKIKAPKGDKRYKDNHYQAYIALQ